jgi:hypothetical protein
MDLAQVEVLEPTVIEQLTRSEIDIQIATAKRYPRSLQRFQKNAETLATADVEVAMSCNYRLPRGGKQIEGGSVRLAEIVANTYGNLRCSSRVVAVEDRSIVCEGVCIDLETNNAVRVEVRRRIVDKNGKRFNDDMVNMTANAACSIAFRNAVFKVVPLAMCNKIGKAAKRVAIGNSKTLEDRKALMISKFDELGVSVEDLLEKLGKEGEADITLSDIEAMIGIYGAISGGDTSVEEQFRYNPAQGGKPTMSAPKAKGNGKTAPKGKTQKAAPKKAAAPDGAPAGADGEIWVNPINGKEYHFLDGEWVYAGITHDVPPQQPAPTSEEAATFEQMDQGQAQEPQEAAQEPGQAEDDPWGEEPGFEPDPPSPGIYAKEMLRLATSMNMTAADINGKVEEKFGYKNFMSVPNQEKGKVLAYFKSLV